MIVDIGEVWVNLDSMGVFWSEVYNLFFYNVFVFMLIYIFIVMLFVLMLGLVIVVGVNNLLCVFKGVVIFIFFLLFFVILLVGLLILFWMVDGDGVIGVII